jgi:hypothetical protein
VEDLCREISGRLIAKLNDAATEAIDEIRRLLVHESPQIRLHAARSLIVAAIGRILPQKVSSERPREVCKMIIGIDPNAV